MKHVVLIDCYGNKVTITKDQAKEYVTKNNTNMFWAICDSQQYNEGDWVELAFFPAYNGIWDDESQENVFCPWTWDDEDEDKPLTIFRHYYHNISAQNEKPRYGFVSAWKSDQEKDPNAYYSYEKPWIFDEA